MSKVDGWLNVTHSAVSLFRDEYWLPLLSPDLVAHAAAYAERLFLVLLISGLFSGLSAAALLGMTLVIEVEALPCQFDLRANHGFPVWQTPYRQLSVETVTNTRFGKNVAGSSRIFSQLVAQRCDEYA